MSVEVAQPGLRSPQQLYEDWERAHWAAQDVDLTKADERSYASYATAQQFREAEDIGVEFRDPADPADRDDPAPESQRRGVP